MNEYRLSPDAEQDIGEMYRRGFWTFGEYQADKFYHRLFDSLALLASFPQTGRMADEIYPSLRRVEFNPYVIFYLQRDYGIYIVRLLKQSQIIKPGYLSRAISDESD